MAEKPAQDRPHIRILIRPDGTRQDEVIGIKGEACSELTVKYRESLPTGVELIPTEEFYETKTEREAEKQYEGQ